MPFYYPLTLGVRRRKLEAAKTRELPQPYDTRHEGAEHNEYMYEEYSEAEILERLQQHVPSRSNRPWLILGEPGAGKTALLEAWFLRWAAELPAAHLGMVVPVLVRLRYLRIDQSPLDSDMFADQLWALGLHEQALLGGQADAIYQPDRRRGFHPVWLLDGLDEVTPPPDERFYHALVTLPGVKVLSCRTAVYETLRQEAARYYTGQEYELLDLKPVDQRAFLMQTLGGDVHQVDVLHQRLQHHPQLRLLASNPLMLSPIAQMPDRVALPMTRAEFYQAAVGEMWRRKLLDHPEALPWTDYRDRVLTELAQQMGITQTRVPLAWLARAATRVAGSNGRALLAALQRTGLVRVSPWEEVDFVHLTFQEYYLAQSLNERGLQQVLADYWHDSRYDEMLGLLVASLFQARQYDQIGQGIRWLVEWG
jgi:predicted NACHT family NTPase